MSFYNNNFLICPGVEKCGTTSLYAFLQDREGITLSNLKETFFFNTYFKQGDDKYKSMFPEHHGSTTWYTDITPSYFRQPRTFENISANLSDNAVFIFLIRNPVKRAFSFYWHDLVRHITKGEKQADEFKQFKNFSFQNVLQTNNEYFLTSYNTVLSKWLTAFPDRVIVHSIEDVIQDPDILIHDINAKTGLNLECGRPYPRENEAWIANLSIYKKGIRRADQKGIKDLEMPREHAINAMAMQGTFTHYLSKNKCEKIFDQFFKEDTDRCEELLGRDLSMFRVQHDLISPIVKSYQEKGV